jgi:hypothetical protein
MGFTSYLKKVDRGRKWWRFWGNGLKDVKIMGGLWLKSNARNEIKQRDISPQEYLEGVAFNIPDVWSESSLALGKLLLITSYSLMVLSSAGILFLVGEKLWKSQ